MSANDTFKNTRGQLIQPVEPIALVNESGEVIPPFAPMKLNGSFTGIRRQVIKPDEDSISPEYIVFNGAAAVAIDDTIDAEAYSEAITATTGTLTLGDDIGTVEDQWYLSGDSTGFKCRGVIKEGLAYASPFSSGTSIIEINSTGSAIVTGNIQSGNVDVTSNIVSFTESKNLSRLINNKQTSTELLFSITGSDANRYWVANATSFTGDFTYSFINAYIKFSNGVSYTTSMGLYGNYWDPGLTSSNSYDNYSFLGALVFNIPNTVLSSETLDSFYFDARISGEITDGTYTLTMKMFETFVSQYEGSNI